MIASRLCASILGPYAGPERAALRPDEACPAEGIRAPQKGQQKEDAHSHRHARMRREKSTRKARLSQPGGANSEETRDSDCQWVAMMRATATTPAFHTARSAPNRCDHVPYARRISEVPRRETPASASREQSLSARREAHRERADGVTPDNPSRCGAGHGHMAPSLRAR